MKFADSDFEFAKEFFAIEPIKRYAWLHDKVSAYMLDSGETINDIAEIMDYISILEDIEL